MEITDKALEKLPRLAVSSWTGTSTYYARRMLKSKRDPISKLTLVEILADEQRGFCKVKTRRATYAIGIGKEKYPLEAIGGAKAPIYDVLFCVCSGNYRVNRGDRSTRCVETIKISEIHELRKLPFENPQ